MTDSFIRWRDLKPLLGISRTTAWRWQNSPGSSFPRPRKLGPNSVAWRASEVEAFIASRNAVESSSRKPR